MAEHLQDVLEHEAERLQIAADEASAALALQFKLTCAEHGIGPDIHVGTGVILNEHQDDLRHFVARAAALGDEEALQFRKWLINEDLWTSSYLNNDGLSPEMEYWKVKHEHAVRVATSRALP